MAKQFKALDNTHRDFIRRQNIFFTATSAAGSRVNISPRSTNNLRVLGANSVAYLDLTGSGNETAAHLKADGRMTIMFAAFAGLPLILRLYGRGRVLRRNSKAYFGLIESAFGGAQPVGARQIVQLDMDLVQTSCGFGVPLFDFNSERHGLDRWAEKKGEAGIAAYWEEKNLVSLDGLPTGLLDD